MKYETDEMKREREERRSRRELAIGSMRGG